MSYLSLSLIHCKTLIWCIFERPSVRPCTVESLKETRVNIEGRWHATKVHIQAPTVTEIHIFILQWERAILHIYEPDTTDGYSKPLRDYQDIKWTAPCAEKITLFKNMLKWLALFNQKRFIHKQNVSDIKLSCKEHTDALLLVNKMKINAYFFAHSPPKYSFWIIHRVFFSSRDAGLDYG